MAAFTKEVPMSLRLTRPEAEELTAIARLRGEKPAALVARYVLEGVRRSRFPAIDFRDGEPGRVAYLAGTRWPVWMIQQLVEEHGGKPERAASQMRRPVALVRMALAYAQRYADEIAACRRLQVERDFEGLKRVLPTLERL
ncbi:MAG TPA: hypothetical protein VF938_10315 [Candidatus Angelobacter sp.]